MFEHCAAAIILLTRVCQDIKSSSVFFFYFLCLWVCTSQEFSSLTFRASLSSGHLPSMNFDQCEALKCFGVIVWAFSPTRMIIND